MHHGMKRRKVYPAGLFLLSIPYTKLPEVITSLGEMEWDLPALSDDPEKQAAVEEKLRALHKEDESFALVK